ncbi:hypothetical protein Bca101_016007 [Brassica carinata]
MSGKGFNSDDDEHQARPEILTLALGWTHSLFYIVTIHLLILPVQVYLLWPLLPNFPHVWGDNVVGMVMAQYLTGVYGYVSPLPEIPALLGPLSHVFGMAAIVMLLVHTVSHHIVLRIAIPSSLWFGSVFLFNLVNSIRIVCSLKDSTSSQHPLLC